LAKTQADNLKEGTIFRIETDLQKDTCHTYLFKKDIALLSSKKNDYF
jgi:hypothetical protein